MGAYENPETYIDTESIKHIQNLQQDISVAFAGYAKSYKEEQDKLKRDQEENAKKLAAIQGQVEDYALSLRTSLAETQSANKEVKLSTTFEPLIQKAVELRSGLLNNTIKDRQKAIADLAKINTAVTKFGTSIGEFKEYGSNLDEILNKPIGVEGGLDKAMPANDILAIRIMQGKLDGRKEAIFEDADADKLVWKIYDGGGALVKSYSASQLEALSSYGDGDFINQIPDMSKSNQVLANTIDIFKHKIDNVDGKQIKESTGDISEQYLEKVNGKVKYTQVPIGNTGAYKMVANVDKNAVLSNPQLSVLLKSRIDGMSDNEIITYNNNILGTSVKAANLKNKSLTPEEKAKFLEDYKEHWYKTQINPKQDLKKPEGDVYIQQTESAKETSGTGSGKPSAAKEKQATLNTEIETKLAEGGSLTGPGGLKVDIVIDRDGTRKFYVARMEKGVRTEYELRSGAKNDEKIQAILADLGYTGNKTK